MAIDLTDWSVTRSTGDIRYIGDDHDGGSPTYATVIEFHRYLQDLADDASSVGDDEIDITDLLPSDRSTDNIITLLGAYNIDLPSSEHLYDGSVIQGTGGTEEIFDGVVNFGNADVQIQLIQDGAVLIDDWWNFSGAGLNPDSGQGISHRFMIRTRTSGADIDGRRLIGTSRTFGNTYAEFSINGTSRGNNVLALTDSADLNNATVEATIAAITDIVNSTEGYVLLDVNNDTTDEAYYSEWDKGANSINTFYERMKYLTRDGAQNITLDYDTEAGGPFVVGELLTFAGGETGFLRVLDDQGVTGTMEVEMITGSDPVDNDTITGGTSSATALVNVTVTSLRLYGLNPQLFRGITHQLAIDTNTGTFNAFEDVSWTGGTGQMFAIDSTTAGTLMWIQLLTGVAPSDNDVITGGISSATSAVNVTITDRSSTVAKPFVGASTGSAIIGAYGVGIETADLAATDKVTDLTNAVITPPNNVTFTVSGLVSGEDRVLVAPWDGTTTDSEGNPAIDKAQTTLSVTLSGGTETAVVVAAIPSDTPSAGDIRIELDSGLYREIAYTSYTGTTYTIASTSFSGDNATSGNEVWIAYIDELAGGTTASFTGVYLADRDLVVIVRDGGGTPIKQFISSATLANTGGSITAIRTSDA